MVLVGLQSHPRRHREGAPSHWGKMLWTQLADSRLHQTRSSALPGPGGLPVFESKPIGQLLLPGRSDPLPSAHCHDTLIRRQHYFGETLSGYAAYVVVAYRMVSVQGA